MASLFPSGPPLPAFQSLLIKGPYHPSAPIHLALSHAATFPATSSQAATRILLITPSRETIAAALREHNDDWIGTHSGRGDVLQLSACTTVFYPASAAHFSFLVEMLTTATDARRNNATTILEQAPSLVVLIGLSAYFLEDVEMNPTGHPWTVSSYMTLVARSLASFAALRGTSDIALALFDSKLDDLKLPILKHPTGAKKPSKLENVAFYVQKYFDLLAVFEEDDEFFLNSSQEDENEMDSQRRNRMHIFRRGQNKAFETRRWIERIDSHGGTVFVWDEINSESF
ncbi:hypothetical protein C8F04DRAFT_1350910 [Mycena alexandri]|uniref:Uncharacterized protein n=1 Tax=Mycena alexandri TaxID=1745969 RepID=A0AAD6TEB6_9AGAR|nr:hypothetical protein C8F04DRAFT_1350910 [Mycena alexandri]